MVKDTGAANERNIELLGDVDGRTVLDIGFGQGRTVDLLVKGGAHVLGVEVSDAMLAQASARVRRHAETAVDLRLGDGVLLPFGDDSADAVITAHTLYFWPEPTTTLGEVRRVSRPEGRFILAFSCADDGVAAWKDPDVYRSYLTDEVVEMLATAGFVDITCTGHDDYPAHMRWAIGVSP